MNYLSDDRVAEIAEIIEAYETQQRDISDGRKDTWDSVRTELREMDVKGAELAAYIANLRAGIAKHWLMTNDRSKLDRKEAVIDGADEICTIIENASHGRTRVHTRGPAKLALVQTEVQTPHDADGVIIEQNATRPDAAEIMPSLPVARVNRPEGDRAIGPDTEEACRSGVKAPAALQNPEPGAGVESTGNGARENPAGTMPEPNLGNAAGRTAEDRLDRAEGASPSSNSPVNETGGPDGQTPQPLVGPQSEIQKQAIDTPSPSVIAVPGKTTVPFIPDPSTPRVRNIGPEPEMPAFLKRATTDQVGRA